MPRRGAVLSYHGFYIRGTEQELIDKRNENQSNNLLKSLEAQEASKSPLRGGFWVFFRVLA